MAWLYGGIALGIWALLAWGISRLDWKRPLKLLMSATLLGLALMIWAYMAPQPALRVEVAQLRRLPSSAQSGLVELVIRNSGEDAAGIVVVPVAYLAPLFINAADLVRANVDEDLQNRLERAKPVPATGTIAVAPGQTVVVEAPLPFSERVWEYNRGQLTLLVAARITYRDRVFTRERLFCQYMNPRSNEWRSCPFMND
jgi:hypothetical protein